jgi:hypothetical protein
VFRAQQVKDIARSFPARIRSEKILTLRLGQQINGDVTVTFDLTAFILDLIWRVNLFEVVL